MYPFLSGNLVYFSRRRKILSEVLKIQNNRPFTEHMEVETYTWEVLPEALKAPIGESIVRELNWVRELLL
jgi:hypothetical protein